MANGGKTATVTTQGDAWLSVQGASDALGESRLKVLSRALKGELESQTVAGRTVISRVSVDRVKASKQS